MKKESSKGDMKSIFQKLAKIKRVEPDAGLYFEISNRLKNQKNINSNWIKVAAAILLLVFTSEIWLVKKYNPSRTNSNELQLLVYQTNNLLYNE